jgi:hypothetical protein
MNGKVRCRGRIERLQEEHTQLIVWSFLDQFAIFIVAKAYVSFIANLLRLSSCHDLQCSNIPSCSPWDGWPLVEFKVLEMR